MPYVERNHRSNILTVHLAPTKLIKYLIILFCFAIVAPQNIFAAGFLGETVPQQHNNIILTEDAAHAYMEALAFSLQQVGSVAQFTAGDKGEMQRRMHQGFSNFPLEIKLKLAQSRETWTHYRNLWPTLHIDEKREFIFNVLAFAYGEKAANNALGISVKIPQPQKSSSNSTYVSGDFSAVSRGNCTYFSTSSMSIASSGCD